MSFIEKIKRGNFKKQLQQSTILCYSIFNAKLGTRLDINNSKRLKAKLQYIYFQFSEYFTIKSITEDE